MSHAHVKAAAGLEGLQPLVGKWHTEGRQHASPFGPAAAFVAVETCEWLHGGQFLIHRMEGHFDRQAAACVEVLGKGADGRLFAQSFYQDGRRNEWLVEADRQVVKISGTWAQGAGEPLRVRYTATFEDAGNTLVAQWEQSRDGQDWQLFIESRATKAQPLPDSSIGV